MCRRPWLLQLIRLELLTAAQVWLIAAMWVLAAAV
jgi:hypothetical protein